MVRLALIYEGLNDEKNDDDEAMKYVTQFDIIQLAKHVRNVTVKDADWVLQHLQHAQFKDLDNDADFYKHSEPLGVSKARILLMFEMLDKNDDHKLSIFEYEAWRQRQTASNLQTILNVKMHFFAEVLHTNTCKLTTTHIRLNFFKAT